MDIADGFGVGTSIAFPKSIDLAMDIVEVDGKSFSKRGKLPGRKQVYRCENLHDTITKFDVRLERCPVCGKPVKPLLKPLILDGKVVREFEKLSEVRERVLETLKKLRAIEEFNPEPQLFIP